MVLEMETVISLEMVTEIGWRFSNRFVGIRICMVIFTKNPKVLQRLSLPNPSKAHE
jgi:hypothetical protein